MLYLYLPEKKKKNHKHNTKLFLRKNKYILYLLRCLHFAIILNFIIKMET